MVRMRPHQWGRVGVLVGDTQADRVQEGVEVGVVAMEGTGAAAGRCCGV